MSSTVADRPSASSSDSRTRRAIGWVLLAAVGLLALVVFDLPNLDGVREDVAFATSADAVRSGVPADQVSNCFQGFCFEDDAGVLDRWWGFASTYVRLTWLGIALALLAAAIVDTLILRRPTGVGSRRRFADSPKAGAFHRGGAGRSILAGGLGAPALAASVILFAPLVVGIRVALAIAVFGGVALAMRGQEPTAIERDESPASDEAWIADVAGAYGRLLAGMVPAFLLVAAIGGIAPQYLTEEGVSAVAGDHLLGIALAVLVGLVIRIPLMYEIPLVAVALLIGVGRIPAAVLLFTASLGAPLLSSRFAPRRVAAGVAMAAMTFAGGGVALVAADLVETATVPTVAFDGERCTYSGPMRFGPGVTDFVVRNDWIDEGKGHTMAIVVGRLPDDVSMDHFALEVTAAPTAPLPDYFTVAGTQEFVFPGTEAPAQITFHQGGRYAAVCLNGGGFYVIFEFSMPQPMGWFDEFRSTFTSYVADEVFTVVG